MSSEQQKGAIRGYFVKQLMLLVITVILAAFFTIPLVKAVKMALDPAELEQNLNRATQEVAGLERKAMVAQSRITMGVGDDQAREKLEKEVEELKRQVTVKELENKNLQDQMALVRTMLEVVKANPPAARVPVVDTGHQFFDLLTKLFGCIGSLFTGGMFVLSWWRNRRNPAAAESQA
ncbi:MAG: hypothetical protein ACLP5H_13790 [Desulfomonilaceae bacterium]